ncbi:PREDICTED: uncharacterized protein LOC104710543 [Camelina sativa]|uniref:Uncharacterized protein LOC104710543 n=1 Tax=Camelina sativa TaxID=90675 RepID=A0ABM0TF34_CAMSA|nr:PREDICTED: uncharacterized protein LOC104710543 [Camelina sativa]
MMEMEIDNDVLYVHDEDDDELISYHLESMLIKNGNAKPNNFVQDVDVFNKNPREVFDSKNPIFAFVKSRTEACGKTDGCESGCWRIMGRDKLIRSEKTGKFLGFKRILKFCEKRKLREYKRTWVMEEYRLVNRGKRDDEAAVICKIRLMFETKITFLLAKHFSYLFTSQSLPLHARISFSDYGIGLPYSSPEDLSYLQMLIDKEGNIWSSSNDVYCVEPSMHVSLDQSYEDLKKRRFFFVKRTKTCGKTDGCDGGCWRIMGRDKVVKSKEGKVLGIKRVFKFIETVQRRYVLQGQDVEVTWVMEEYRLTKKKKQDEVICVIKLLFPYLLNHLLRRW